MANRLFLKESGLRFLGDPADEDCIHTITSLLSKEAGPLGKRGAKPISKAGAKRQTGGVPPASASTQLSRCSWDAMGVRKRWSISEAGLMSRLDDHAKRLDRRNQDYRQRYEPSFLPPEKWAKIANRSIHVRGKKKRTTLSHGSRAQRSTQGQRCGRRWHNGCTVKQEGIGPQNGIIFLRIPISSRRCLRTTKTISPFS